MNISSCSFPLIFHSIGTQPPFLQVAFALSFVPKKIAPFDLIFQLYKKKIKKIQKISFHDSMLFSDMERKTLAITPPSFFFHHRGGAAFGSSKAFHCLLLISCLLLSSVNTLHNLAEYGPCGSDVYNTVSAKGIQGFNDEDSEGLAIQNSDQNVCPSSLLFSFLSEFSNQSDLTAPFFGLSCPNELQSSSVLLRNNLCGGVVWLSLKPVHIIEFQPFSGYFHIGDTSCYKPLWKELHAMKNTRDFSISVIGKQYGGNGFMVNHHCEGLSSESEDSIKFLFFYQAEHDSWTSGVAIFSVPMKATAPILMLNLNKKPVFWVRTKKILIALLIVAALLILIFCFNDHFIDESNKGNSCSNHMERKVEKPSTITISPEMDSLLRSISKESLHGFDEVPKSSNVSPMASASSTLSSNGEASEAVNLTVKTAKDKKRRRNKKKKKGGLLTSELTDVSSSHSGNSTPRSPLSPEPPITEATTKPIKPPKPVLSHSAATIPVSEVKSVKIIQQSSLAPNVRAPGAKSRTEVKEEKAKEYRYDIWGDHLTGLHLMDRFKEVKEGKSSGFDGDESESFFVKGPQNLLADSHAMFVSFCNQWG